MATKTPEVKAATLAGWKKAAVHYPTLPSGTRVGIKIPDLPSVIASGGIPQTLLDVALGVASKGPENQTPSKELIGEQAAFADHLVKVTVVEPKLSDEDLAEIPYEDKVMLVEFATRQRDLDALGEHIAGLPLANKWEPFREGDYGDEALASS